MRALEKGCSKVLHALLWERSPKPVDLKQELNLRKDKN